MILYDNLWKTMEDRGITKYQLIAKHGLSPSLITRLRRNQNISTATVDTLCRILNCDVGDIMRHTL